jgi:hypothetical protein
MSLIETSSTATHKTEHRKPKPVAAPATHQEFEWGAEAIGRVINRNENRSIIFITAARSTVPCARFAASSSAMFLR